jgi:hypothetical protein
MKEVLIYGALIAAVLGVSTTMIGQLQNTMNTQSQTVNTAIETGVTSLVNQAQGN